MHTSTESWIRRSLKTFVLWGYGWKRRKQRESVSYRIEWMDPASGQWYGEKTAVRLLKAQVLAEYPRPQRKPVDYRAYF
jgi:hypothetical protein